MVFLILFQVFLIILNAIFAAAEIAVLSISETKLERLAEEGNRPARRLRKLTREPAKFLATIQVAITLSGFLGSAFAADNFSEPLVNWLISLGINEGYRASLDAASVVVITLILSYFTLVFGELVPKRLAMSKSEQIAMGISGLVRFISTVFRPIVWFLSVSTNLILRLFGVDPNQADDDVSEEEIRMMVDAGTEKGTIDDQEKEFIENVFEFNDTTAGEICTHRTDVIMLDTEDDDATWAQIIHDSRHTRYPICEGAADNILGVLNAKDYFRLKDKSRESIMQNAVREAYFVPDSLTADILFRNMKETRNSMALVMDEYGGLEGIITMYDLIEELVGELDISAGEQDNPDPYIEKLEEGYWKLHGNVALADLKEETGIDFESEDYDTFSGFAFDRLGYIPADGEKPIEVTLPKTQATILKIEGHQIELATLKLIIGTDAGEDSEA